MNEVREWKHCIEQGATAYRDGKYELAQSMLLEALSEHCTQEDFKPAIAIVLENLALVLIRQKRYARAERMLRRALALTGNLQDTCRLQYKLAELYLFQGRFSIAEHAAKTANMIGECDHDRNLQVEIEQQLRLSELWNRWGQSDLALATYNEVRRLRQLSFEAH